MTEVALGLLSRDGRWFLQRRDPNCATLPGLWEFPGGKLEPGETPEAAMVRELEEEVQVRARALRPLPGMDGVVRLHPFLIEAEGDPRTGLAWGWFTPEEMHRLAIPPANVPLVALLARV